VERRRKKVRFAFLRFEKLSCFRKTICLKSRNTNFKAKKNGEEIFKNFFRNFSLKSSRSQDRDQLILQIKRKFLD
jgi:hypothetical protein